MEKHEVNFGGVYRLLVGGELVGEFAPGPLWSELYQLVEKAGLEDVSYKWIPFQDARPTDRELKLEVALQLAREALTSSEAHIPQGTGISSEWIRCGCGNDVKKEYWTRHSQGSTGSALDRRTLELLEELIPA